METFVPDEPPVLTGKPVVMSAVGTFEINGNRFILDKMVHNLTRVPKSERERIIHAVAAMMILRCPPGQYGRNSVFDAPDEFYVQPESGRIRVYAYNWGQPLSDHDLMLLRSLVPRSDSVCVAAMPLYSSPGERVTTVILDMLTDQEVTRRASSTESLMSSLPIPTAAAASSSTATVAADDAPARFPLIRTGEDEEGSRKRRWVFW